MNKIHQERRALCKSFLYAFHGIRFCVKNERNMRIHLAVAVLVTAFSLVYGLTPGEYAVLFLTIGAVIAAEAVNTAIEAVVNLESPSYNELARIAKDVAAGTVLLTALTACIVGFCLFFRFPQLTETLHRILTTPWMLLLFLILLLAGGLFAFRGDRLFQK